MSTLLLTTRQSSIFFRFARSVWSSRHLFCQRQHLFLSEMSSIWDDRFSFPMGLRRATVMSHPESVRQIFENRDGHLCAATGRRMVVGILPPESLPYQADEARQRARKAIGTAFAKAIRLFDAQPAIDQLIAELSVDRNLPEQLAIFSNRLACQFVLGQSNSTIETQSLAAVNGIDSISPVALAVRWVRWLPWHKRQFATYQQDRDWLISEIELLQNGGDYAGNSFLDFLIRSCDNEGVSQQQCQHNATLFIMAIAYNLRVVLLNALQHLAENDHWQTRLGQLDCQRNVEGGLDRPSDRLSRAIIKESLRLKPLVPLIGRYVKNDTCVNGFTLKAGQLVFVSPWISHLNPSNFDHPTMFDPNRFLTRQNHDNKFLPFGGGDCHCLATGWVTETMGRVVREVVRHFTLQHQDTSHSKRSHQMAAFNLIPSSSGITVTPRLVNEPANA